MGAQSPVEGVLSLGKYVLLEKIGEGYLGSVYRGFDQNLARAVTVRTLCDGIKWDPKIESIFDEQCRAVAALHHPAIASIIDAGKQGSCHFLVMESLGGASLQSLIAQKPAMTAETKVSIMIQVAEGLDHAHKNGILHRDLAPAKIHLTSDGEAKIRDFALAYVLRKHLPHPAIRWGIPIYISPEQVQQKDCDSQSDIFSAGTIFYELLTYHHPFYDKDGNKALDNILLNTDIPTFEMFPDAPPGIWPILKTCLEKNPKDRYQGMNELADACRDLQKDLAEDTRLMLAELYAALSPLKAAAAQPDAPESTVNLLKDIQKLLRGEKQADYASLDRLMTILLEQYPVIRAAAGALSTTDSADMQPPLEEVQAACAEETSPVPLHAPVAAKAVFAADTAPAATPLIVADANSRGTMEPSFAEVRDCSPLPPPIQANRIPEMKSIETSATGPKNDPVHAAAAAEKPLPAPESPIAQKPGPKSRYRKRRTSYRAAAALLALLVIAAAAYIVWGSQMAMSLDTIWNTHKPNRQSIANAFAFLRGESGKSDVNVVSADAQKQPDMSRNRANSSLQGNDRGQVPPEGNAGSIVIQPPPESIAQITELINAGKLQLAKAELNKLQKAYPGAYRVSALRRQLQAKDSTAAMNQTLLEQERENAAQKQREDEYNRQVITLFGSGKYSEAENILNLWLAENPGNWDAHNHGAKIGEIQRNLKTYTAAIAENRYQDALNAIINAERMNPADASFAELRRQAESRKASARASLTVHRLGPKGSLFLDGRPISNDGELENESIPIGNHLLTVENGGNTVFSRRQEYVEGQRVVLVYDLDRQYLRPMADSDRELLAQRKAMEEVRLYEVEHLHGTFRGSCRGTLAVDYLDIAFKPSSGFHGFRMPFKVLKLSINGRSINLLNAADGIPFQSFKFRDEQSASKFKQSWDELKSFARQVAESK